MKDIIDLQPVPKGANKFFYKSLGDLELRGG